MNNLQITYKHNTHALGNRNEERKFYWNETTKKHINLANKYTQNTFHEYL